MATRRTLAEREDGEAGEATAMAATAATKRRRVLTHAASTAGMFGVALLSSALLSASFLNMTSMLLAGDMRRWREPRTIPLDWFALKRERSPRGFYDSFRMSPEVRALLRRSCRVLRLFMPERRLFVLFS